MDYYDDYTGSGAITMDDFGDPVPAEAEYPAYLRDVPPGRRTYGTLSYNRKSKCWTIKGDPCVTELAKRLFPGCDGRGRGVARFTAHRRIIGDLNWLMLRYPLQVKESDRARWESALEDAREYAIRREQALAMPETASVASALAMPDSLSFGQYDTDILAGTCLDSASDKLLGETGAGLLASL